MSSLQYNADMQTDDQNTDNSRSFLSPYWTLNAMFLCTKNGKSGFFFNQVILVDGIRQFKENQSLKKLSRY